MGCDDPKLDGCSDRVDTGRGLTAVHHEPGRESDGIEILRATELPRENARLSLFGGDDVNIVGTNHDDDRGSITVPGPVRKFANLSND